MPESLSVSIILWNFRYGIIKVYKYVVDTELKNNVMDAESTYIISLLSILSIIFYVIKNEFIVWSWRNSGKYRKCWASFFDKINLKYDEHIYEPHIKNHNGKTALENLLYTYKNINLSELKEFRLDFFKKNISDVDPIQGVQEFIHIGIVTNGSREISRNT